MVLKFHNPRRRILKGNRRSQRVYRRRSVRSSREIRGRMEKRRESDTVEREDLCSQLSYTSRRDRYPAPQFQTSRTSRLYQDT